LNSPTPAAAAVANIRESLRTAVTDLTEVIGDLPPDEDRIERLAARLDRLGEDMNDAAAAVRRLRVQAVTEVRSVPARRVPPDAASTHRVPPGGAS